MNLPLALGMCVAVTAFVLTSIIGVACQVSLAVVALRALSAFAVFGALSMVAIFIVRRGGGIELSRASSKGGQVDIVLPEASTEKVDQPVSGEPEVVTARPGDKARE